MVKPTVIFDIETYKDYFLVGFLNAVTGQKKFFEQFEGLLLDVNSVCKILNESLIISFNGKNYDIPVLSYALKGAACAQLKKCSDDIIVNRFMPWDCENKYNFRISQKLDHIDVFAIPPGKASLKLYGGRLHSKKIQELPLDPSSSITPEFRPFMREYNGNDLITTQDLYNHLRPQIALREEMGKIYGADLRSHSDAQIAEYVIKSEVEKLKKCKVEKPDIKVKPFKFNKPDFISFETELLQGVLAKVLQSEFEVSDTGKVLLPKEIADLEITIGRSTYKFGLGGCHSTEESVAYHTEEVDQNGKESLKMLEKQMVIKDRDVRGYYPAIILGQNLYPPALGREFLTVFRSVVNKRVEAKLSGNKTTAETLKITTNSSYGKMGNKWSCMFSPNLVIQTTITGQLALLMLIEMLELEGIAVISANTDGIVFYTEEINVKKAEGIISGWELITGFETEETQYNALYSRDINNYIALKTNGAYKSKGAYAPSGLQKNPANEICVDAVIKYLQNKIPIEDTINSCQDIRKFITVRQVTGGAVKDGEYIGKVCRWYYSMLSFGNIEYKLNGNKVPRSEGAMPCMVLPDTIPDDLDRQWYVDEAYKILEEIGA